jgi:hypothetical protein
MPWPIHDTVSSENKSIGGCNYHDLLVDNLDSSEHTTYDGGYTDYGTTRLVDDTDDDLFCNGSKSLIVKIVTTVFDIRDVLTGNTFLNRIFGE